MHVYYYHSSTFLDNISLPGKNMKTSYYTIRLDVLRAVAFQINCFRQFSAILIGLGYISLNLIIKPKPILRWCGQLHDCPIQFVNNRVFNDADDHIDRAALI